MDIDVAALKALVTERELSLDTVVGSIEQALLVAYHHTPGAHQNARVELDRATGHVTVWAIDADDDSSEPREFDDTPPEFGRIAATQGMPSRSSPVWPARRVIPSSAK